MAITARPKEGKLIGGHFAFILEKPVPAVALVANWGPPYPQGVEQVNIRRKKWKKRGMWNFVEWADFFVECPKIFVES